MKIPFLSLFMRTLKDNMKNIAFKRMVLIMGFFFLGFFVFSDDTFAQFSYNPEADSNDTLKSFAEFAALIIQLVTFVSLLILSLAGDLLGTEFITGDEAMAALRPMWIFVRNLTNIGFVLALIYLSFSNLFSSFGVENQNVWTIKDKLPRIIFAIIAVNFSLLGFRLMIDAVNVGTVAVLGIADVQLEAQSSTSVESILKKTTWSIIADPGESEKKKPNKYTKYDGEETPQEYKTCEKKGDGIYYSDTFKKKKDDPDNKAYQNKIAICTSFSEGINGAFCPSEEGRCFFKIKDDLTKSSFISSSDNTAQNLFMSFGTVFMRLETLPTLAADVKDIFQVIDNTLFSFIMALAYGIVLIGLLIVLVVRVVVLWLGLVFSPFLVAGGIMGLGTGSFSEDLGLFKYLLAPIKIGAAFAISFVMMSGMIEFRPHGKEGIFKFGAGLSGIALDEYSILWQAVTVGVFWMASKMALKDLPFVGGFIEQNLMGGAEKIGSVLAKSATTEAQLFTLTTKDGDKQVSLETLSQIPTGWAKEAESKKDFDRRDALTAVGADGYYTKGEDKLKDIKASDSRYDDIQTKLGQRRVLEDIFKKFKSEDDLNKNSGSVIAKIKEFGPLAKTLKDIIGRDIQESDLTPVKIAGILNKQGLNPNNVTISDKDVRGMFSTDSTTASNSAVTSKSTDQTVLADGSINGMKPQTNAITVNETNNTVLIPSGNNTDGKAVYTDMRIDPKEADTEAGILSIAESVGTELLKNGKEEAKGIAKNSKSSFESIFGGNKNIKEVRSAILKKDNGMTAPVREVFEAMFGKE